MGTMNDYPSPRDFKVVGYIIKSKRVKKPHDYYFFPPKEFSYCKVEGCGSMTFAKGYCKKHYHEHRKGTRHKLRLRKPITICSKCDQPAVSRGLCKRHYNQWHNLNKRRPVTDDMVANKTNPYPCDEWLRLEDKTRYIFFRGNEHSRKTRPNESEGQ